METSNFLRDAVLELDTDLKSAREEWKDLGTKVTALDKHLAVMETRMVERARFQSGWTSFIVAIATSIVTLILGKGL